MSYFKSKSNIFRNGGIGMRKLRICGKLSLVWLLALAVLLCTGIRLVGIAKERRESAAEVFANGRDYEKPNAALTELLVN